MSEAIIKYGTSAIEDGPMNLNCGLPLGIIQENQRVFLQKKGYAGLPVIQAGLEQGKNVRVVNKAAPGIVNDTDGLITIESDLVLILTAADCLPVWIFDKSQLAFGLVHAGWRGLTDGVLEKAVSVFRELGFAPADLIITVGPHISAEHFEIKEDILDRFAAHPEAVIRRGGRINVDLFEFAKAELMALGCKPIRISGSRECTYARADKYYSYRREKELPLKAQLAYIVKTNA